VISGHVSLEKSSAPECQKKREPRLEELLLTAKRNARKDSPPQLRGFTIASGTPGKNGDFLLNKLGPGPYAAHTRFLREYWYLRAVTAPPVAAARTSGKGATPNQPIDVARAGLTLQLGSRTTGVVVSARGGAASVRRPIAVGEGKRPPAGLSFYIVPAEKEKADDAALFTTPVADDGNVQLEQSAAGSLLGHRAFAAADEARIDLETATARANGRNEEGYVGEAEPEKPKLN